MHNANIQKYYMTLGTTIFKNPNLMSIPFGIESGMLAFGTCSHFAFR